MIKAIQGSFKAILDEMPLSQHRLTVSGQVEIPTTGWRVDLVEVAPQGVNAGILILKGVAAPPTGPAGNIVMTIQVQFQKAPSQKYSSVTVNDLGSSFSIPVEVVQ